MNAAPELLAEAARHGVHVEARGDRLHLEAPAAPPAELVERLRAHRNELVSLLARCEECRQRIAAGSQNCVCRKCPAWRPMFERVVPYEVMQRVREMRRCPACRRLGARCHVHYVGPGED